MNTSQPVHASVFVQSLLVLFAIASATGALLFIKHSNSNVDRVPTQHSLTTRPQPTPSVAPSILFRDVTDELGIQFQHIVARPDGYYFPDIMSSGGAIFDLDGDGRLDILLLNGSQSSPHRFERNPTAPSTPSRTGNRLYRQEADGRFTDATLKSGLSGTHYASGVAIGDINNDGFPDIYISNVGDDQLYLNQHDGSFSNVTLAAGIANPLWGTSASFLDFDRDGWLDLFVVNYVDYHPSRTCINRHGRADYCHPSQFEPTCHKLYRNVTGMQPRETTTGSTVRFEDVSLKSGIFSQRGPGLGVYCADFNHDLWQDIYVANDSAPNFLWINQQNGTFRDEAVARGVATDGQGQPQSSMGVSFGDLDGDGLFDLLMTHFRGEPHTLYRQIAPTGQFIDDTVKAGLYESTFDFTGFGIITEDLDQDGDLDLAISNGHVKQLEGVALTSKAQPAEFGVHYRQVNQVFVNDGAGRFQDERTGSCGFRTPQEVSRGLACGDVNGDGALDLLITNAGGKARLCYNSSPQRGNWLLIRAILPQCGARDAYGAMITVTAGKRSWQRIINSSFSYLSASDPRAHFGLGTAQHIDQIVVRWPDGKRERFSGGAVNRVLEIAAGSGVAL